VFFRAAAVGVSAAAPELRDRPRRHQTRAASKWPLPSSYRLIALEHPLLAR